MARSWRVFAGSIGLGSVVLVMAASSDSIELVKSSAFAMGGDGGGGRDRAHDQIVGARVNRAGANVTSDEYRLGHTKAKVSTPTENKSAVGAKRSGKVEDPGTRPLANGPQPPALPT